MKILIVMDPGILVPPEGYGGIERMVEVFAKEYIKMGNEVHLLVTPGSYVEGCTMHPFGKEGFPQKKSDEIIALPTAWKFLWKHRNDFDLVHNFGRLAYLVPLLNHPIKKIMTYQREISNRNNRFIDLFPKKNMVFTACSANLLSRLDARGSWEVVYNAVDFNKYDLQEHVEADAPLIFLGRIEKIKGCHTTIQVAKDTGNQLIIAGNISPLPEEKAYFEKEIKPFIDDKQIVYVGALNDEQKNYWLGKAKAFLFPIEWNEPFGIVMIEAMACGTPVIAFNSGSVNEVVDEGITGFKVNSREQMNEAVRKVAVINRAGCRMQAGKRFDLRVIASRYLQIVSRSRKKILIVTTGQPAANPRVMKEYDAFIQQGYKVKVLYTYSAAWSYEIDQKKFSNGELKKQDFVLVGGNPFDQKVRYAFSRICFKFFRKLSGILRFRFIREMSMARSTFYLWMAAKRFKADVCIAHYLGALPAAARSAKKHNSLLIFDAEDYHRGEEPYYPGQIQQVIEIENNRLPSVDFITTASPLISRAYQGLYPGIKTITLNNVFSRRNLQPAKRNDTAALRLFWFSQYIGPKRGLEKIIEAMNMIGDRNISLHILGNIKNHPYVQSLLGQSKFPENIELIGSVPPDEVFTVAAQFDVGIAAEIPYCENRNICLTNKIFTYLMAGNCVLASNTESQKYFMEHYPGIGLLYEHDSAANLAVQIKRLHEDRSFLNDCKNNASALASTKMNWEKESESLIALIEETHK